MTYKSIGNFFVIGLIDRVHGEGLFRVQCVCGSIGKISESGLVSSVSCGCTSHVRPHRLGLKIHCYTFSKFLKEDKDSGKHLYVIDCSGCGSSSTVPHSYSRERCPKCPKVMVAEGEQIDLSAESERIGIHVNALRQRVERMGTEKALSMPRKNVGGCRGKHGKVSFRGRVDTIPGHLRREGSIRRKGAVYYWVRQGMSPADALSKCLDGSDGMQVLDRLFPTSRAG